MKIRKGIYLTRNKELVRIIEISPREISSRVPPLSDRVLRSGKGIKLSKKQFVRTGFWYEDGEYLPSGREHDLDLIKEVTKKEDPEYFL